MNNEFILTVLEVAAPYHEVQEFLMWDADLNFYLDVSDFFAWGFSDVEEVTYQNLPVLEEAIEDVKKTGAGIYHAPLLFAARVRECRPQGAYYKYLDRKTWTMFDEVGPTRENGLGNPMPHPDQEEQ